MKRVAPCRISANRGRQQRLPGRVKFHPTAVPQVRCRACGGLVLFSVKDWGAAYMRDPVLTTENSNDVAGTTFLPNPDNIRKAVRDLQKSAEALDLAVAFVGADWQELLSGYGGKLRVICWLSSTNTNPYAVEGMTDRPNTEVRRRDSMHCKVYLSPAAGAVVGSANLSKAALAEGDNSGQDEAAVYVTVRSVVGQIEKWFERLWNDEQTRPIERSDIAAARIRWDRAQEARLRGGRKIKRPERAAQETFARIRRQWEEEGLRQSLRVADRLGRILQEVEGSLEFLPDPIVKCRYMNVGEGGRLLLPGSSGSYDQPIRLTVNKGSVKITALSTASRADGKRAGLPELREDCKRRLDPLFKLGSKNTKKAREYPAVRVERVTGDLVKSAKAEDAVRHLFEVSMREWRKKRPA